jgi:membrane carboxypeptidase/penicillin-binding protein
MRRDRNGLSVERTSLAWSRSALSAATLAAVTVRAGISRADPWSIVPIIMGTGAAVVLYLCGRLRRLSDQKPHPASMALGAASVAVVAVVATAASLMMGMT